MSALKSEFIFTLSTPLSYHEKGQLATTSELLLKAPSSKQRNESAKLKQGFFRALKDMESVTNGKTDVEKEAVKERMAAQEEEIGADEILSIIMMSNVDLGSYQESFRTLLLNDACMVGGSTKLTAPMFDNLSDADTERLLGEYLANFLLASHIQKMVTK